MAGMANLSLKFHAFYRFPANSHYPAGSLIQESVLQSLAYASYGKKQTCHLRMNLHSSAIRGPSTINAVGFMHGRTRPRYYGAVNRPTMYVLAMMPLTPNGITCATSARSACSMGHMLH